MFSLRYLHGLDIFRTDNLTETVIMIKRIGKYLSKTKHKGISGDRTGYTVSSAWGRDAADRRQAQRINFLMGMGIGVQTAKNILAACGGKIPLNWGIGRAELMGIPLIGESTAERLLGFFE